MIYLEYLGGFDYDCAKKIFYITTGVYKYKKELWLVYHKTGFPCPLVEVLPGDANVSNAELVLPDLEVTPRMFKVYEKKLQNRR